MGKAGTKKPRQKPTIKLTDKEQSERFIEAARTLDAEADPKKFEQLFERMAPPKRRVKD